MARPALLLLPGIEGDRSIFDMVPDMVDAWELVPIDLPAKGTQIEDWATAVLSRPELPHRFALLGASLGGLIAWHMAYRAPDRVNALVAVGTLPGPRHRPRSVKPAAAAMAWLPSGLLRRLRTARLGHLLEAEGADREIAQEIHDVGTWGDRLSAVAAWRGCPAPSCPVLWLRGQSDREAPWTPAQAETALPWADVRVVPGGHWPWITHPVPFWEMVGSWLVASCPEAGTG